MTDAKQPVQRLDGTPAEPLRNGYYVLPRGKLVNHCIYLDMHRSCVVPPTPAVPAGVRLERLSGKDAARYLRLFRTIGERWLWAGHLAKTESEISALLDASNNATWLAVDARGDIGVLQLEFDPTHGAELVYFGLIETTIGRGIGRWLIATGIAEAFARSDVRRLRLHTCNFDSPKALAFYQAAGFRIHATGFEVMDDPRLAGRLPTTAAPHVALVP